MTKEMLFACFMRGVCLPGGTLKIHSIEREDSGNNSYIVTQCDRSKFYIRFLQDGSSRVTNL